MTPFAPLAILGVLALFSRPSKAAPKSTPTPAAPPRPVVPQGSAMDAVANASAQTAKAKEQLGTFATNVFNTLKF